MDELALFKKSLDDLALHKSYKHGLALKKPLLLLLVLTRIYNGENTTNEFRFETLQHELGELIKSAGGRKTKPRPEYPFFYLQTSPLWNLTTDCELPSPKVSVLRDSSTKAHLAPELFQALERDRSLCLRCIDLVLNKWWPVTLHRDIKQQLGLPESFNEVSRRPRYSAFVKQTLENYRNRCAICGFDLLVAGTSRSLEAAHIHWHAYGGPDSLENGIALCRFHHWALDNGVVGIRPRQYTLLISEEAEARCDRSRSLLDHLEGQTLCPSTVRPGTRFLEWHLGNVFRG